MYKLLLSPLYLTVLFILAGCIPNEDVNEEKLELTISAAASLNDVLTEIEQEYEKENENIDVLFNFGGSGSLQQQILQGAPVDLFFSAAEDKFDQLQQEGLLDSNFSTDLVGNQLTLIIPKSSKITVNTLSDLLSKDIKRIGIGTPETVPAGLYVKQTLENLQLWDKLEEKLIPTKDVRQVLSYVATNNVDAGIVYQTDAILSQKVTIVDVADASLHEPIVYPVGIINETANKDEAIKFFNYLTSDNSLLLFEKYGFSIVGN